MKNYVQHVGLTAWRKKSSLLLAVALVAIILFGLHYTQSEEDNKVEEHDEDKAPAGVVQALIQNSNSVKFVESEQKNRLQPTQRSVVVSTTKDNVKVEKVTEKSVNQEVYETEQQLGIPFVNLDIRNPYIPKKRIVHLDLKGAPPKIGFLKKFFPMVKNMGATGLLLEYEDMFPFEGVLKNISAKNAYTVHQIQEILELAEVSKLEVIPLIQTFGHVEFALKHKEWSKIREVPGSPQAVCPSKNSSMDFIGEMITQVISLHPKIKYIHIGCDEVFQMGECELCRLELHENLFLRHVRKVATYIRERWPDLRIIVWDDMLRHLSQQSLQEHSLGALVEPMIWVYAEDIYRFVQPQVWEKFAAVFKTAWTASAFKGAFGESLYIPDAKRHLENNLRWLDVMSQQSSYFKHGLVGMALTGWQRYDHFAVLCELLPAAIPSLALDLIAVSHGYFNASLRAQFLTVLSCPQPNSHHSSPFINLDSDPHLWEKLARCMFPGSPFFRLTYRLHNIENEALDFLKVTKTQKGWLTDYNVRHNYSLPLRVDEVTTDLPRIYHGLITLARSAVDAMEDVFDVFTITEWIEQRIYPYIVEMEKLQNQSTVLRRVEVWPSRPVPPLKDLQRLGISLPP